MRKDLKNFKILVVGDTIIDNDIFIEATGLSLESPTIKGKLKNTVVKLGGASNVVKYLHLFGCCVTFITAIKSEELINDKCKLINVCNKKDNIKNRYWLTKSGCSIKYLQINDCNENDIEIDTDLDIENTYDAIVVTDYRCGLINSKLLSVIEKLNGKKIGCSQISDKQDNFSQYKKFDTILANESEYQSIIKNNNLDNVKNFIVTLGENGSKKVVDKTEFIYPAIPAKPINTIGAGDAFCAAYVATECLEFANKWASYVISNEELNLKNFYNYV